jgi:hypothetical protein
MDSWWKRSTQPVAASLTRITCSNQVAALIEQKVAHLHHPAALAQQHKDLRNILQGASVTLQIILLGVGGTIYNTNTLKPFKELGLDSQRVKKLASKLHVHSVNFAA